MDALQNVQKEGVSRMRASLLACDITDISNTKYAINQITVLRIYHQLSRIIRYTELMDKLESKLYNTIDAYMDNMDLHDVGEYEDLHALLNIQSKLQTLMIESHKLLQPYLDLDFMDMSDLVPTQYTDSSIINISAQTRETLRNKAKAALDIINAG